MNNTARVAPEKQGANVPLPAVFSQRGVSTLETDMAKKSYYELLRDPRWQKRRLERMSLAAFTCETCESTEKTLNVHHKFYRKGAMPWDYSDHQLQVLCEDCHVGMHALKTRMDEALAKLEPWDLFRTLGYAEALNMWGNDPALRLHLENYEHASGVSDVISQTMSTEELFDLADANHDITGETLMKLHLLRKHREGKD
jgi:5-methylcytosine-specific restriction endonuclease McrA